MLEGILAANPQSVADYKGGKEKAMGFLVGQTMKAMKGKADPGMVNKLLKELLAKKKRFIQLNSPVYRGICQVISKIMYSFI